VCAASVTNDQTREAQVPFTMEPVALERHRRQLLVAHLDPERVRPRSSSVFQARTL
jgi:hypothetical protein